MDTPIRPLRAILNFAHRCAMRCEWCYVPFGAQGAREEVVAGIIRRVADLGFKSLTIGGGDPFQYRFLPNTLRLARSLGLFVHVDTHGKGLRETLENLELIQNSVDLLGLPIDGSSPAVHDLMRSSPGHFNLVASRLRWLGNLRCRVKLNTVISAVNLLDLPALSQAVSDHHPARWSIYQYWALGPGARVAEKHSLADDDFISSTQGLRNGLFDGGPVVEINVRESRRDTYPIIHHDGEVFAHTAYPENAFTPLGSLFDTAILEKINQTCATDRPIAATRYLRKSAALRVMAKP